MIFFSRALTRAIDIGMSIQKIEDDVIDELLVQGGAVSPIVTIEPRRRKFHKPITVTLPLPERAVHMTNNHGGIALGAGGRKRNLMEELSVSAGSATSIASSRKTSMESVNKIGSGTKTNGLITT